jgi:hydroxymethylglutaryl-CoA lyase
MHAREKVSAAWEAGCRNFDSALGGYGGCPMAEDELVGNLSTESILHWANEMGFKNDVNLDVLEEARKMLASVFLG